MSEDYSFIGVGALYLEEIGGGAGLVEVGNCSAHDISVALDEKKLKNYMTLGGGTRNSNSRIDSVNCKFTVHDINAQNLARSLYGSASAVASSVVSGEAGLVYPGALTGFASMPAVTPAPTVVPAQAAASARTSTPTLTLDQYYTPATPNGYYYKVTTAGTGAGSPPTFPTAIGSSVADGTATVVCAGKTTLAAGTDYEVRAAGIFVSTSATIAGETWTLGYTKAAVNLVHALSHSGKEYRMRFEGYNEARGGKRLVANSYRVKLKPLNSLPFIGEDYAGLEIEGELLQDSTKTGAGISQFFDWQQEA